MANPYRLILDSINDIMAVISTLQVSNKDNKTVGIYTRIFNNQIEYMTQEKPTDWIPRPACLVEIVNDQEYQALGLGYRISDLRFRCHLLQDFMNKDGTRDQDLLIFSLRDSLISLLSLYSPVGCGPLVAIAETQEYDHKNMYHYIVEFKAAFVDGAGSVKGLQQMSQSTQLVITPQPPTGEQYGPVP